MYSKQQFLCNRKIDYQLIYEIVYLCRDFPAKYSLENIVYFHYSLDWHKKQMFAKIHKQIWNCYTKYEGSSNFLTNDDNSLKENYLWKSNGNREIVDQICRYFAFETNQWNEDLDQHWRERHSSCRNRRIKTNYDLQQWWWCTRFMFLMESSD